MFVIVKISVSQGGAENRCWNAIARKLKKGVIDPPFPIRYCGFFRRFQCLLHSHFFISLAQASPKQYFSIVH